MALLLETEFRWRVKMQKLYGRRTEWGKQVWDDEKTVVMEAMQGRAK